jgi:putative RecB family exonuclease
MVIYSHSRISCFENCPFKYKLKYIDKAKPEIEQTIEAFLGSVVHNVMEKLYRDMKFHKLNTLEELLAFYNQVWKREWNSGILLVRKEYSPENYRSMGETYVQNYYKRHHPFDHSKTVGLEQRVLISLDDDGRYMLQGYIDRLACADDGVYEVHDYKTNSSLPLKEYLINDRQLALYALAVLKSYPNAENVKLIWHFLPFNQDIVLQKTGQELERLRLETIEAIHKIESAHDFPTNVSPLCDWCEFRGMCPEWAHVAKTEAMSVNQFLNEPGVKLVNRYAELTENKKLVEDEMEKIKEALFKFAVDHGVNLVAGSGYNAKIWRAERLKFPGKEDSQRKELEDFLQKAGLWKDVSTLDTFLLSKAMERPPWPADIAKAVEKFGKKETIERLYLRKKDSPSE